MCKNEGLGMKSDEVSKSLNQHHNIDLYMIQKILEYEERMN